MGHDVADMGVLLDGHEFIDVHAAESADASQVVSFEVDEHEVFRPFLFIRKQFADETLIVTSVEPARPGSGYRARVRLPVVQTNQPFGRGADQVTSSKCMSPEKGEGFTAWRRR